MYVSVEYSCGHEDRVWMQGTYRSINEAVRGFKSIVCPSCARRQLLADGKEAARHLDCLSMPELVGTDRAVREGEEARAWTLVALDGYMESFLKTAIPVRAQQVRRFVGIIAGQSSAEYWIDSKGRSSEELIDEVRACARKIA